MLTSDYTQEKFKPLQFIPLILEYSLNLLVDGDLYFKFKQFLKNCYTLMTKIQTRYCRKRKEQRKETKRKEKSLSSAQPALDNNNMIYILVSFLGVDMANVVDCVRSRV